MPRVRIRIGGLLAATLVCALVACGSDEERAQAALQRFESAVVMRDNPAAILAVEDFAAASPDSAQSAYQVAQLWVRAGEYNRALWLLEESIERFSEAFDLPIMFAEVSLLVGDASRAMTALERIPEDAPQAATAALLRARAQRALGEGATSLATLEAAEQTFDDWSDFRGLRVEYLVEDQRFDDALELIRDARASGELAPEKQSWFAESEASLLARDDQVDEALRILMQLTEADPENQRAWGRRAQLLAEQRRFDESCELLGAALELRPDLGFLYDLLAAAETGRGNPEQAEAQYRKRVEVVADVAGVERLALFLFGNGRAEEAVQVLDAKRGEFAAEEATEVEYLEIAILLDIGDLDRARARFDEYRRRHWSDPRVEYLGARFELADGDAAAAAERLNRLLPRFDRSDVQHWYGKALQALGDYEGAENRFGLAVLRNPQQVSSHKALIALLERRGAWNDVRDAAEHLLRVQPTSQVAVAALSQSLIRLDAPEAAEQFLRAYAASLPDFEAPTLGLASALRAQGRAEESLEVLEAARERFGANVSWRAERALSLVDLGRSEEALAELDRPDPVGSPAALHRIRSIVLFSSGRGSEGVIEAERAFELEPEEPAPLRWLADHHAQRGDLGAAAAAYRRYLTEQPADAEAYFRLGVALDGTGETQAAIAAYRQAVAVDSNLIAPRNNLALVLEAEGRRREALVVAQEAYARESESPMVLDTLGWLYVGAGRAERGVRLLERAHALLPEDPSVAYHLAIGLGETGRTEESRALLQKLEAQLAPDHELRAPVAAAVAALESSDAS